MFNFWKRKPKQKDKVFKIGYRCANCGHVAWVKRTQEKGSIPVEMWTFRHECPELVGPDKPLGVAYSFAIKEVADDS